MPPLLSPTEISFFKREGYLIKRGVLDRSLMQRARRRLWDGAPASMRPDDQRTWVGPFAPEDESQDRANHRVGFRWNFRQPGGEDWMVQLLATDPRVWAMAEQFLGHGQLVRPDRIRGIYCTLPYGKHPAKTPTCHVDAHPFHLGVVGYIDYVPPQGGAFCVWPQSHRAFYPRFHSGYKFEPDDQYEAVRARISAGPYVDCHGGPGDIVFWHHRLGHMAGHNLSHQIRQAVLYDFRRRDLEQTQEEPPTAAMWRDWSAAVQAAPID